MKQLEKIAVDNLSFNVNQGEIFGLLGPNGLGKTTTLRMISTLIRPEAGDIIVAGNSVVKYPQLVRKDIGFLTTDLKLDDHFSPNYLFHFFSNLYGIPPNIQEQRKKEIFEVFGIDKYAETKIANLSTGMKQKVSLAISIVHSPSVIIFDEPTNGLDILTSKLVENFLLKMKQEKKTIIISTHIFSIIENLCDQVGIIIDGNLYICESLKELTKMQSLEDVFFSLYNRIGRSNK